MNKERRTQIKKLTNELEDVKTKLKYILRKEEGILDNTPENLQGTDRYSESENAIETLSKMNAVTTELENAIEKFDMSEISYMKQLVEEMMENNI